MSEYQKNIGTVGGACLLISSITGPGLLSIPALFQQAGWLLPVITFVVCMCLGVLGCLFLIESMTYFPENGYFERNVEITVLVHHFYGRKWYYLTHIILYGSLQSFNIASIISGMQQFDAMLVNIFKTTCGFSIAPQNAWICVHSLSTESTSPFGNNYMMFTIGGLLMMGCLFPLVSLNLSDNMIIQFIAMVYLFFVTFAWGILALINGVIPARVPMVGDNISEVLGQALFSFTLANTAPSWVNASHKSVDLKKVLWEAAIMATALYIFIGFMGGLGFDFNSLNGLDIPSVIGNNKEKFSYAQVINNIIVISFPVLVYVTSIPVSMIIIRLNLLSSGIVGKGTAEFLAVYVAFLVPIPFQTGTWLNIFTNWTSLIFQTLCNFMLPFMIFLFLHKRNLVINQSVLDELDFLDLGGFTKENNDEEYEFVYHLPHANPDKLVYHGSVSDFMSEEQYKKTLGQFGGSMNKLHSNNGSGMFVGSAHSMTPSANKPYAALIKALEPSYNGMRKEKTLREKFAAKHPEVAGSESKSKSNISMSSAANRASQLAFKRPSVLGTDLQRTPERRGSLMLKGLGSSIMNLAGGGTPRVRQSIPTDDKRPSLLLKSEEVREADEQEIPLIQITVNDEKPRNIDHFGEGNYSSNHSSKPNNSSIPEPLSQYRKDSLHSSNTNPFPIIPAINTMQVPRSQSSNFDNKSQLYRSSQFGSQSAPYPDEDEEDFNEPKGPAPGTTFFALPEYLRRRVHPKIVATISLIFITSLALVVLVQNILNQLSAGKK